MKQPIPFGKYYLLERVNVGGMAEVFKAKATGVEGFERLVAVKRILPSIAEDEEFITMFVDEAKIAVQLTHANIAQIFDLGRVEGSFFIALEYVSGKDLRAMWNRTRQRGELLPVPLSCYAIMKVCEGLDYAHNKHDSTGVFLNLVHRDVSPQNVLISYEGEVKIIDFGIAKAAGKVGRTQAGILKGKFGYMSPEQVLGLEIDRRSDVFGVGICLYELLTGERLFVAETDFATLEKVRSVDIMPPSTYNRRIPEELEQIVMRALARDRDLRYQTAMQLHDELQAFMHTSGNLFSRKDLSAYMHRVFAEEIEKESARDHEYAQLDPAAGSGEANDLAAFDTIDPVSTVSAFSEQTSYPFVEVASASSVPNVGSVSNVAPMPEPRNRKATLLGIPAAAIVRAPSVPRLVPSPASVPPMTSSRPPVALADGQSANMWDDDELSTQIYDKPDYDKTPLPARHGDDDDQGDDGDDGLDSLQASVPEGVAEPYHPPQNGGAPRIRAQVATLQLPAPQPTAPIADPYTRKRGAQKGHPMLAAVFAVVAIIACIVLGLLLFGEREPATVNVSTTPTRVSVSVDDRSLGTSSSPFVIGELSAGKRHDITISSPGFKPWTQSVELKAGEVLSLPPVQLVRIDTGFALSSEPSGAAVLVDGKALPNNTPVRVVDLPPGDHVVRLEKQGYAAWESPIHANVGTVLPLPNVSLQPLAASEPAPETPQPQRPSWSSTHTWHRGSWSSSHGSSSSSNSHNSSAEPSSSDEPSTPEPAPAPAREEPSASSAPAPSASATSVVDDLLNEPSAPPEHAAAPAAHSGGTGKLRVNSRPWSQVFVDGKGYGPTPRMNIELSAGTHTLKLVNDEFSVTKTVEVNITAGKTETVVLNLGE